MLYRLVTFKSSFIDFESLCFIIGVMNIKKGIPLAIHTTFKIGGNARYFCVVKNEEELRESILWAKKNNIDFMILSGGSNILFSDNGFDGLVIKINLTENILMENNFVTVSAGVSLKRFLEFLAINSLMGFTGLYGIPGSVGGAIRGNAGAFGVEIKDCFVKVRIYDTCEDKFFELNKSDMNFDYRHSIFKEKRNYVITNACFKFDIGNEYKIREEMFVTIKEREKRQLQNVKAAGSFFKNPYAPLNVRELFEREKGVKSKNNRVPAGWLIDKLGFKGKKVGGAMVSLSSANYILNHQNATSEDVINLTRQIKNKVKEVFDINLEEEVSII